VLNVQFDEAEKVRMKEETLRLEGKQKRQMSALTAKNEAIVKELDEVYVSRTLLTGVKIDRINRSGIFERYNVVSVG